MMTVGVVLLLRRLLPAPTPVSLGFALPKRSQLFFAAQVAVGMVVMNAVIQGMINRSIGSYADPGIAWMAPHRGIVDYCNDILVGSVATPIVEETLFRGLLFAGLAQWVPAWLAAPFSALVFALWHQEPYGILQLTVMGVWLAYAYYGSGTLWAPIAVHAANNWLVITVSFAANSLAP